MPVPPFPPPSQIVKWDHPLQQALWRGDDDEALRLIAAHRFIRARDCEGVTALHWACQWRRVAVVEALLDAGAEIDARTICGGTPLMWAVVAGSPGIVTELLIHGADANAHGLDGYTPLHLIVFIKDHDCAIAIAALLIAAGADVHAIEDEEHTEALTFIEENAHPGFTDELIKRGISRGSW